jgi:hypothetical protein
VRFGVSVALLLVVGLAGCGSDTESSGGKVRTVVVTETSPPTTAPTTTATSFVPYSNDVISTEVPAGWSIQGGDFVDKGSYHETKWVSPDDPDTFVLIDVNDAPSNGTPMQSATNVREGASKANDYQDYGFTETNLGGVDTVAWNFLNNGDRRVDYFFDDCYGATSVAVLGSADQSSFDALDPAFRHVAKLTVGNCEVEPPPEHTSEGGGNCEPSVPAPGPCLQPFTGDPSAVDCPELVAQGYSDFEVLPPDPYHLDGSPPEEADSPDYEPPDGTGCESY